MISAIGIGCIAAGTAFAARPLCIASRGFGAILIAIGALGIATPAFADETLLATDNSEVACTISKSGLTRVSLKDDRFASVSKLTTGVETEDFSVVNEPTRGDIYISVPEGFDRSEVSFFGTTAKGYVYKFACRLEGERAQQVFVENRDIMGERPAELARAASPQETSASLVQAMYQSQAIDGFEISQPALDAVMVGDLKVQMITEYRGLSLAGRVLRIENTGRKPVTLDEQVLAPSNAVAVSVADPDLAPGKITTAYIVTPSGQLAANAMEGRP
ncbi:type-F conjugative transfer system secretin TraK [Croceicoccus marinus]|uniref:Type-F conjugative transfer system secretin TraK n=1 Tax=Croceicoccus marinus TaxID=450378 RepID=A0A7G6W1B3_9SPHN|nr:type-F conjugative transfer system secretin TraK [Croceicoccus marinus]QNE07778.1 type-F conjugative transfer system secretin TraK [Croceicoccus marinus]